MQAIAERGDTVLVALEEPKPGPFDQTRAVVVNTRRNTVGPPGMLQNILARGYWTPFQGDPAHVIALASSALTAASWDESKHPRHPAGSERGGEFRATEGELTTPSPTDSLSEEAEHWGRKSPGHVVFADDYEYFQGPNGDVYRAPRMNPFDRTTGFRTGARFEFPFWQIKSRQEQGIYPFDQTTFEGLGAAGFDESKVRRYPKGTPVSGKEGGGRFAPKEDTPQQKAILRQSRSAARARKRFPAGTRVRGRVGGQEGTVVRHVPNDNAQGGTLLVRWDNGQEGRVGPATVEAVREEKLVDVPSWLQNASRSPEAAYNKATRPTQAADIARGWLEENGFADEAKGNDVEVVAAMEEHYPDGYEFFLSINDLHKEDFRRNYMRNGEYVPERRKLHDKIRASYLKDARAPEGQPWALFLAGGSGAGKSTIVGKQRDGIFEGGSIEAPEYAVYANPDDIKELLPESQAMKEIDDPRWAALAHEESSDIAARLRKDAEQAGFPMVIDGTGDAAPGKFLGKIREAEQAGYRARVVLVDIPTEEAIRRAHARALKTGRKVSDQTIRDIHREVTVRHLEWRDEVANWEVWANDEEEQGGRRLLARRVEGGEIEILEPERYAQVEAKANDEG